MAADGVPLTEARSDDGMARLAPEGFEAALLRLVGPWLSGPEPVPVVICGMAGARQGWREAPYRPVPCPPLGPEMLTFGANDPRLAIAIVPGLSQARPADVMRGEETQIAGLLAAAPGFDGIACLPGTHTKWAHLSAGEVVGFQTCMTGELFALLSGQSVLRHSVGTTGWDREAFAEAVADAMSTPQKLAARLFGLRAEALLSGLAPDRARARLSGLLIGLDLAASRPYWLGQEIVLIGEGTLAGRYAEALVAQGAEPRQADATEVTLAGLRAARAKLAERGWP
ncbi:2-dehydro-3-deoxygalactonokinase [Defluviimonas sp. SAOS-178_SWC]|uniref:2-dehydro-3-deoxygalactonokinase n=1 Tax=Defluviimonas sp. SAOS-178_SWC TaxID=3121287 RepID=UPI0032219B0A